MKFLFALLTAGVFSATGLATTSPRQDWAGKCRDKIRVGVKLGCNPNMATAKIRVGVKTKLGESEIRVESNYAQGSN